MSEICQASLIVPETHLDIVPLTLRIIICYDYFFALFFLTPGSESESVVPRVPPALTQSPRLEVAVLGYLFLHTGPLNTDCDHLDGSLLAPVIDPAHLYVGQGAGLTDHTQEPPEAADH